MTKGTYRELVTINGRNVVLAHNEPPVINAGVLENADIFRMINIFAETFSPTNIDKADGTPLRGDGVAVGEDTGSLSARGRGRRLRPRAPDRG